MKEDENKKLISDVPEEKPVITTGEVLNSETAENIETAEKTETVTETKSEKESKISIVKGKKKKKNAPFLRGGRGQAHIKSTYNNTLISITDLNGAVLLWSTAGKSGFKGPKKSTPYAAGIVVKNLADKIKTMGIKELDVYVSGVGTGREAAVRAFDTNGIKIISIKDTTPVPHGGCRPRKRRRI